MLVPNKASAADFCSPAGGPERRRCPLARGGATDHDITLATPMTSSANVAEAPCTSHIEPCLGIFVMRWGIFSGIGCTDGRKLIIHAFRYDLTDLRLFVHVAEATNITRRAARTNVSLAAAGERWRPPYSSSSRRCY
jgi:hypothetical protein